MIQLILHLTGDYLLQNDWMAQNKKKHAFEGTLSCFIHCVLYSVPFLLIGTSAQVFFIFVAHYVIDRTHIVSHYMNFYGQKDFAKPPFAPWSIIIVDNTFHLICNYLILQYVTI